jgi:hypothetical protein
MMKKNRSAEKSFWSAKATKESDALDLKKGVFTLDDPKEIAASLLRSAWQSERRKAGIFQSAMSMLNFYINRAGKNLSKRRLFILNKTKDEMRKIAKKQ